MTPSLRLGHRVITSGSTIPANETTQLHFTIEHPTAGMRLTIAGEDVPLVPKDRFLAVDSEWASNAATSHLVGTCPIELSDESGFLLRATLDRMPDRVTLDQYHWMLDWFSERLAVNDMTSEEQRAQIWAELSPRIPTPGEEDVLGLVLLWQRTAASFRAVLTRPTPSLQRSVAWMPVHRLTGSMARRISARSFSRWDPPWPQDRPVRGTVAVERSDDEVDTAENRFARSVAEEFARRLGRCLSDDSLEPSIRNRATAARSELSSLITRARQLGVGTGPRPQQSFLLRDNPAYSAVASADNALRVRPSVSLRFPPLDVLRAIPISPWSLNVLYERWITTMGLEWAERRFGTIDREPVPTRGSWSVASEGMKVTVRVDEQYPREGTSGVICPTGKSRPDLAIEFEQGGATMMIVSDATWSRNTGTHQEKFTYARNFEDVGSISTLTNRPRKCVLSTSVSYPGGTNSVLERTANLGECLISLTPSDEGERLFHAWLDDVCPVGPRDAL